MLDHNRQYKVLPALNRIPQIAPKRWRYLAFLIDATLVYVFLTTLLIQYLLPTYHAEGFADLIEIADNMMAGISGIEFTDEAAACAKYMRDVFFFGLWIYFFLNEMIFKGSSLGKKCFHLKVAYQNTWESPTFGACLFRSCLKSFCLTAHFVITLINFFIPFFNPRHLAGHDFLAKTWVINDNTTKPERKD